MEYPNAFNCLTRVQFHSNQGRFNALDERVQGKFLKGSFLGSKMDSFFGDGVGGLPCKYSETNWLQEYPHTGEAHVTCLLFLTFLEPKKGPFISTIFSVSIAEAAWTCFEACLELL